MAITDSQSPVAPHLGWMNTQTVAEVVANVRAGTISRTGYTAVMAFISLAMLPAWLAAIWLAFIVIWELAARPFLENKLALPAAKRSEAEGFGWLAAITPGWPSSCGSGWSSPPRPSRSRPRPTPRPWSSASSRASQPGAAMMAKNGLRAAGMGSPAQPFDANLIDAFQVSNTWIDGAFALEQGFIFTAMILSTATVLIIERKFTVAGLWLLAAALLWNLRADARLPLDRRRHRVGRVRALEPPRAAQLRRPRVSGDGGRVVPGPERDGPRRRRSHGVAAGSQASSITLSACPTRAAQEAG